MQKLFCIESMTCIFHLKNEDDNSSFKGCSFISPQVTSNSFVCYRHLFFCNNHCFELDVWGTYSRAFLFLLARCSRLFLSSFETPSWHVFISISFSLPTSSAIFYFKIISPFLIVAKAWRGNPSPFFLKLSSRRILSLTE